MKKSLLTLCALLLGACASQPPPPDWQANAFAALGNYSSAYLEGNTRVADLEFARAKVEVSRTGRPDLMARLELVRCAAQVASLVLEPCTGYLALAADAKPPEQAYAAFLSGHWAGLDAKLLPVAYQGLVASPGAPSAAANSQLSQIQDPLSSLIAAGVLLQKELLSPVDIGLSVEKASSQGWRRPLLAWLGVQLKRAQTVGNTAAAQQIQRRIDLVLQAQPAH
ncbi:MAG: hypothetical protein PHQ58_08445 [Rhodoferax sp.]|uniref:hypothetical protein n=1 Tax=Rhodoferax sp. TaxID=50421 RepID=UPI00261884F6|nr:hypothetical protein [Rhodoferax sp.]MDD2880453.1 hypothetical protein [Rhodoferax sp.]